MARSANLHSKSVRVTLERGEREFLNTMEHEYGTLRFSVEYEPAEVAGAAGDLTFYARRHKNPDGDETVASYTWTVNGKNAREEVDSLRVGFAVAPDAIRSQLQDADIRRE